MRNLVLSSITIRPSQLVIVIISGGLHFNRLRSKQKITRMIDEIADPLMSVRKEDKRQYVIDNLVAKIPKESRVSYDSETCSFVPIDDNEAATKITQKLRDRMKVAHDSPRFRNYAFYPGKH